jgi:hypothetical protein
MKWMIYACFALLLTACSASRDSSNIPFLNGVEYNADTTSRITKPSQSAVDQYEAILLESGLNIPLYRCLYNDGVTTYLGIPFDLTIAQIAEAFKIEDIVSGEGKKDYKFANGLITPMAHAYIYQENGTIAFVLSERRTEDAIAHPSAEDILKRFQEN